MDSSLNFEISFSSYGELIWRVFLESPFGLSESVESIDVRCRFIGVCLGVGDSAGVHKVSAGSLVSNL